jgi:Fur family ferric uptake transcriptional regulator
MSVESSANLSELRGHGRRLTRQRALIWGAFADKHGVHLSAADVAEAVKGHDPALHQATVYRTLDTLVEDGLLLRTDLHAERSYYELPSDHRHHHLVCTACGVVAHVHDDAVAATLGRLEATTGFSFRQELSLPGLCVACAAR